MFQSRNRGFVEIFVVILVLSIFISFWWIFSSRPSFTSEITPVFTSNITITPTQTPVSIQIKQSVLLEVPFVSQAPTGNWADARQQDGCEEAAAYMAYLWAIDGVKPKTLAAQEEALLVISDWEEKTYGSYHDTGVSDTVERIFKGYFKYENVEWSSDVSSKSIKQKLSEGNLVIIPADGQKLGNPYFTPPGPERHNLVIIGYDDETQEFVTNDNGTKHGKDYKYKYKTLIDAIRDYPTGNHLPIVENKKAMIIVSK